MSVWTNARVTPIFIVMGKFKNSQDKRYAAGTFQIVQFDSDNSGPQEIYINPLGTSLGFDDLHGGSAASEDADLKYQVRNGFGYLTQPQYLEWAGFGNNQTNSLLEMHFFGPM